MAAEEGETVHSHLTTTGHAVARRLIQSNLESLLEATGPLGMPATEQSEIIRDCYEKCVGLVADELNGSPYATMSMDEASRLILSTLLILQDERPPPREQLCLGLFNGLSCGQKITRIQIPWAIHQYNLDVTVRLRRPAGSYVATTISMFPFIRMCNHPRLCDTHEGIMNETLGIVLLSKAFRDGVNDAYEIPTGFRRNRSWRTFIKPHEESHTEVTLAFVDHSSKLV